MKIRKTLGYVVYVFIISLLIFGCMSLKTHVGPVKNIHQNNLVIEDDFRIGGENFAFLIKEMTPALNVDCDTSPILCQSFLGSTASGVVLSSDKTSILILTAAHFCLKSPEEAMFEQKIIGFPGDEPRDMMILKTDPENDLCLLLGPKKKTDYFKDVKIANSVTIGESVYTVAAPLGIAGPGMRLIFEGRLSGCGNDGCISTIPATFGSSGAGIFNSRGELITIVMAVPQEFSNVTLSPAHSELIKFILDIDEEIDIYPY